MIGTTTISTLISISIILQEADTVTVHIQLSTTLVQTMNRESYSTDTVLRVLMKITSTLVRIECGMKKLLPT